MSAFDKIIGYDDIKAELMRFCDVLKNSQKYSSLGVTLPRGILLYGIPGLGKTLMAKCFIQEAGCKAYTLRKDKPDGDFTNKIRETFKEAKEDDMSIVFLDDLDKFANEDETHKDAEEYVTVQTCIDDSKDKNLFVIATINDKYSLPDSLIRAGRFDKLIEMRRPHIKDTEKIIGFFLDRKTVAEDVDAYEISRLLQRRTCAELENVVNEAGIYAGFEGRAQIEKADLVKACMRMVFDAPESTDYKGDVWKRRIAVHEAGHTAIGELLDPGSVSLVSVENYTSDIGGVTLTHTPEEYNLSKELLEHGVIRALGGKAATEIIFGKTDVGCDNDMHYAFDIVARFVDDYCSYGFEAFENRSSTSAYVLEKKDRIIGMEMEHYYQTAKKLLAENREFFDSIVEALMEKTTLTYKEIQEIREAHVKDVHQDVQRMVV